MNTQRAYYGIACACLMSFQYTYTMHHHAAMVGRQHHAIQHQFLQLQRNAGINTPPAVINSVSGVSRGTQQQFNAARANLNTLLSQSPLDAAAIEQGINQLAALQPARWPRVDDYRALFARIQAQRGAAQTAQPTAAAAQPVVAQPTEAAAAAPSAQAAPQPQVAPRALSHAQIQEEFRQIRQRFGLPTTHATMQQIARVRGGQGTEQQFAAVRSQLNQLLAKDTLTDQDIAQITGLIQRLEVLNPARWPRPEDYREVLRKRM